MAYNPLTGVYTPDPAPAYDPLKGMTSTPPPTTPFGQAGGNTGTINSSTAPADPAYDAQMAIWNTEDAPIFAADAALQATLNAESSASPGNKDAFALLEELFRSYGLDELVPVIREYMLNDVGPNEARVLLKQNPIYKTRFNGNELRIAKGLNALSEADYLALENDYSETLTAYGLSDYFGSVADSSGRKARTAAVSNVIGGDISAVEFKDRIKTAVARVKDADAGTKDAFRSLYNVTDTDLIKYFLDPKTGSAQLQQKVTAAEISGSSLNAGLGLTSLGTSEELAKLGITKAMAQTGYSNIAEYLPRTTTLSQIYDETGIQYTKATGEEEEFMGLASAKRKRQQLKALETGAFSGSSGISKVSLKGQTGSF